MVKAARDGKDMAITPDGPRGPARVVQPGAIWLARLSGRPLLPVAFACRPAIRVGSWDRIQIPLPLGRGVFVYGDLMWVARDADEETCELTAERLAARLDDLTGRAQERLLIR